MSKVAITIPMLLQKQKYNKNGKLKFIRWLMISSHSNPVHTPVNHIYIHTSKSRGQGIKTMLDHFDCFLDKFGKFIDHSTNWKEKHISVASLLYHFRNAERPNQIGTGFTHTMSMLLWNRYNDLNVCYNCCTTHNWFSVLNGSVLGMENQQRNERGKK